MTPKIKTDLDSDEIVKNPKQSLSPKDYIKPGKANKTKIPETKKGK